MFIKKKELLVNLFWWVVLILVFLSSRFVNLGVVPIFTDEAIYLRWSQIMAYDSALRYMPLVDGKPPFFMWLTAGLMRLVPQIDILYTGRIVSIFGGLGALIGIFLLAKIIYKKTLVAYLAAFLYLISPFTFFYDRFGLVDGLLAMFGIWALVLGVLIARMPRFDLAFILGWVLGFAMLTKTPAIFFLLFQPFLLVFFPWQEKDKLKKLFKWSICQVIVLVSSQIIFSVLRLFPLFHMISQKNMEFVITKYEFLQEPFKLLSGNVPTLLLWETEYLTWPFLLISGIYFVLSIKRRLWSNLIWYLVFFVYLFAMGTFNKVIFPRYLLLFTPVLFLTIAKGIDYIASYFPASKIKIVILLMVALSIIPFKINFDLLTNPQIAKIPDSDSRQYINGKFAGNGVSEIRDFLKNKSKQHAKITVATEGTFGLMPYSLQLYQKDYPNVEIKDYWPLSETIYPEIENAAKSQPTYLLIYQREKPPSNWNVKEELAFKQGLSADYLRLYLIVPR